MGAALAAVLLLVLGAARPAGAQAPLRLLVEENFRAAPGGAVLAVLSPGAAVTGGALRDRWREATLEGWVPARSVQRSDREGYSLVVVRQGGALHHEPDGAPAGRLHGNLLLEEVARRNGWVRVRRKGWVWAPSLTEAAATPAAEPAPPPVEPAAPARTLHARPGGDTLATLDAAARVEVVGREGEWARVRVEGWVRVPPGTSLEAPGPEHRISLRALREDPDRYRGQTLAWRVQHVALQTADSLRTDFRRGEPYLLVRDPGGEPGFVYVAVPPELLAAARRLVPLQRVTVVGRVRTGRSAMMGHPVLELVELRP